MQIYSYDRLTGEYLGAGVAFPNPVRPDDYDMPAFATDIAPPPTDANRKAIWRDDRWQIVADHRGETWFKDNAPIVIASFGDPAADGLVRDYVMPPDEQRAAHRQALAAMEMAARNAVISPGNLRLLHVKSNAAGAKVTAGARGKIIDARNTDDKAVMAELVAVGACFAAIDLHFAEQEAALDDCADDALVGWQPRDFSA